MCSFDESGVHPGFGQSLRERRTCLPGADDDGIVSLRTVHELSFDEPAATTIRREICSMQGFRKSGKMPNAVEGIYLKTTCKRLGWRSQVTRKTLCRPETNVPDTVLERS
jgi:hypothetical protein